MKKSWFYKFAAAYVVLFMGFSVIASVYLVEYLTGLGLFVSAIITGVVFALDEFSKDKIMTEDNHWLDSMKDPGPAYEFPEFPDTPDHKLNPADERQRLNDEAEKEKE